MAMTIERPAEGNAPSKSKSQLPERKRHQKTKEVMFHRNRVQGLVGGGVL